MEARLFWISLACGLYGFLFRQVLKQPREKVVEFLPFFHALFGAASGSLAGMLAASYLEQTESLLTWSIAAAVPGLVIGWIWAQKKSKNREAFSSPSAIRLRSHAQTHEAASYICRIQS